MQQCPECDAANANRNIYCAACGELIRVDPGFAKKVRRVVAEDRKKHLKRYGSVFTVILGLGGVLGFQGIQKLTSAAVQRARPAIEAEVASVVQANLKANLPAMAAEANRQVAAQVRRELEAGYLQAARREAEKIRPDFSAHFAAIQAEEDAKLRSSYQQAQASFQSVSSPQVSYSGALLAASGPYQQAQSYLSVSSLPASGGIPTTPNALVGTSTVLGGSDLSARSLSTLTVSMSSTLLPGSAGSIFCLTDAQKGGTIDPMDGKCKEIGSVQALAGSVCFSSTQKLGTIDLKDGTCKEMGSGQASPTRLIGASQ